jgi:hypothetical protein
LGEEETPSLQKHAVLGMGPSKKILCAWLIYGSKHRNESLKLLPYQFTEVSDALLLLKEEANTKSDFRSQNFQNSCVYRMALGPTQPLIQWVPGALSLGVKWPGHEADHSPSPSAKVKNEWSYTSTPPICLHGVVLS